MTATGTLATSAPVMTVTVVLRGAMAVIPPSHFPPVAMAEVADVHSKDTFTLRHVESTAGATRRSVPPTRNETAVGKTEMATGGSGGRTDTVAVALSAPAVAVTVVEPGAIAMTEPSSRPTVATDGSADAHSTTGSVLRFLASTPRAESDDASPATRFSTRGDTVIATVGPNNGSVIVGREASSQASDANAAQTSSGRAVH